MDDHVDVLIVGAGLSGIGAACHLTRACPDKTYAILEARDAIGGTWDIFRYPGVRSDSDMFTLGYGFRPWRDSTALAGGDAIREYVRDTAREYGVEDRIRYHHKVTGASWSSVDARWTVTAQAHGEPTTITCSFLFVCSGYYSYDGGYTPDFAGREAFRGRIVHPQQWPEDLEYEGQRVVVIGSGATAVTLVPAMAETAGHVTMLQRSPTYVVARPANSPIAEAINRRFSPDRAYRLVRWLNIRLTATMYNLSRRAPGYMARLIRKGAVAQLPEGYDVDTHFTPRYKPWDQRMCLAPDGDIFRAIRHGRAEVVTGEIDTFTEDGIRLADGTELPADIIVTATGLTLVPIGGLRLTVDGAAIDVARTVAYKGMMLSGVPNFAMAVGYTNASWTLKCDLVSEYVCRLLNYFDSSGYQVCTPVAPTSGELEPLIANLNSGYVRRGVDLLPRQGPTTPWRLHQNYRRDVRLLRHGSLRDKGVRFSHATASVTVGLGPAASGLRSE